MKKHILKALTAISREGFKGDQVVVVIDKEKCLHASGHECQRCNDECPKVQYMGYRSIDDPLSLYRCIQCGECLSVCPKQAITVGKLPPATAVGDLPTAEAVLHLQRKRRTTRSFTDQPVSDKDFAQLVEAYRYAPRGHCRKPFGGTFVRSPDQLQRISEICMNVSVAVSASINLPGGEQVFRRLLGNHTYEVFSGIADNLGPQMERFDEGLNPMTFNAPGVMFIYGPEDELMVPLEIGMAVYAFMMQAEALGLATCCFGWGIVAGQKSKELQRIIQLPEKNIVWGSIIFGHPKNKRRPFVPHREYPDITTV